MFKRGQNYKKNKQINASKISGIGICSTKKQWNQNNNFSVDITIAKFINSTHNTNTILPYTN